MSLGYVAGKLPVADTLEHVSDCDGSSILRPPPPVSQTLIDEPPAQLP
jgi:hypothetical protein